MTAMYGISVIDDKAANECSDALGIGVTAIVRLKHAALYEAAKVMGSATALAAHLGVTSSVLGEWINLKSCPPRDGSNKSKRSWTEERIAIMEAKLYELTGKTWEELWPDELRENHEFLDAPKSVERVYTMQQSAMLNYAAATTERILEYSKGDTPETPDALRRDAIDRVLRFLSKRERKIISDRFGFTGTPKTFDQIAIEMKLTRTRVHQILNQAIRRIRVLSNLAMTGALSKNSLDATKTPTSELVKEIGPEIVSQLEAASLFTIEDVCLRTCKELRAIRGIGGMGVLKLIKALKARGLCLKPE